MNRKYLGALTLAAVMTGGCLDRRGTPMTEGTIAPRVLGGQLNDQAGRLQTAAEMLVPASPQAQQTGVAIPADRKLIRNGEMTIEVQSVEVALGSLGRIVGSIGGQLTHQLERQNEYGARTASVTWLVPAARLDAAIDAARALGKPQSLSFKTEDVTTSYFDVSVRIDTQKQLEQQLVALLRRPGNKLSDLLEVEREVARVRQEIDQLEGRIRLWDNQIAMSTLAIALTEPAPIVARTGGPLRTLIASFGEAGENFVLTVAGLITIGGSVLPVALLLAGPAWLAVRAWRRRFRAAEVPAVQ